MASITKALELDGWNYQPACDRWWREDVITGCRVYARMIDGKLVQFPTAADIDWSNGIDQSRHVDPALFDFDAQCKAADAAYQKRMDENFYGESHPEVKAMCAASMIDEEDEAKDIAVNGRSYCARLRDQFAMHFLMGLVAKHGSFSLDAPNAALKSYEFADAMMIAREMKR